MRNFAAYLDRVVLTLRQLNSVALLVLSACASGPDFGLCEGICTSEDLDAFHALSPDERVEMLDQLQDSVERIALISAQIDREPQSADLYCGLLPRGISRSRCLHVVERPHLWTDLQESTDVAARAGPGPTHSKLRAVDIPLSEWIHSRAELDVFGAEVDVHAQAWSSALGGVYRGQLEKVGSSCASVPSGPRWRYDCFYSAAQAYISRWGRAGLKDAIGMCGASGAYRGQCVTAVIRQLALRSPSSDVADPVSWAPVMMAAHDLRDAAVTMGIQDDILDRFWAETALNSVYKAQDVSGDLLDALPQAAAPHVRSAVAYRILSSSSVPLTMAVAIDTVSAHLNRRVDGSKGVGEGVSLMPVVSDLWPVDRKGEAHLSAISYLGSSRRTVAADPDTDVKIAVMEAAARLSPPWAALIATGTVDVDQRVRWTAARLEERLGAQVLRGAEPNRSSANGEQTSGL